MGPAFNPCSQARRSRLFPCKNPTQSLLKLHRVFFAGESVCTGIYVMAERFERTLTGISYGEKLSGRGR